MEAKKQLSDQIVERRWNNAANYETRLRQGREEMVQHERAKQKIQVIPRFFSNSLRFLIYGVG